MTRRFARISAGFLSLASLVANASNSRPSLSSSSEVLSESSSTQPPSFSDLKSQVQEVKGFLLGTMDSSVQSLESPDYFDVTIKHCALKISDPENLDEASDSEFLLILQSISAAEAPYRIRVAKLRPDLAQAAVASSNYLVRDSLDVTKMCGIPESERVLQASDLVLNKCTTYLRKSEKGYTGGTLPEGCPSDIRGAVKVSNQVNLGSHHMTSWDRGWKADGSQAWGAVKGPYRFRKVKSQDPLLAQLAGFMSGRFDNSEQVAADPSYTPVSYHICQVDSLSRNRPNVRLMLAKQSIQTPEGERIRSRIYRYERGLAGEFLVTANKFDETKISPETCEKNQFERMRLDLDTVQWDKSCPVVFSFNKETKSYVGSTPKEGCPSSFRGSVLFTSEETISDGVIAPWERWLDASGKVVAGSEKGAYVYKRIERP